MTRVLHVVLMVIAAGPLWAQGQGQIVIPDDGSDIVQQAPAGGGTGLTMRAVTVKDQSQLRGSFGDKWQPAEVRERAAITCAEAGMRLVYFQPESPDSRGQTKFAAVCQ
ncbi:hypothetical protein [Antarctobacter jejuensis]|uniref:hypothetical protein n=1 Tax=Antarctobacter jejuensis TaxID=1439938 RepID=UPI003FD2ABFB